MPSRRIPKCEFIKDIDRLGRPYTLALTHYFAADTGEHMRTFGRVINSMNVTGGDAAHPVMSERYGQDEPTGDRAIGDAPFDADDGGGPRNGSSGMLSWKLMKATEAACQSVCMGEEAADHYGYSYSLYGRWVDWWRGFVAGWVNDKELVQLKLTLRIARALFCQKGE